MCWCCTAVRASPRQPHGRVSIAWATATASTTSISAGAGPRAGPSGALIADVERIRRITGDDRAIVVGHSFGGLLAALYAAEFPDHVAALVLIDPASVLKMPAPGGDLFTQVRDRLPAGVRQGYDHWLKGYFDFGHIFDKSESDLVAEQIQFFDYYRTAFGAALPPMAENTAGIGGWGGRAAFFSLGRRHDWRGALHPVTA